MNKKVAKTKEKPKRSFLGWIKDNKTFVVALCVILLLMIVAFILSQALPAGEFVKRGDKYIFQEISCDFPFWQFLASPFLLFGTSAGITVAIIVSFLFVISGAMEVVTKSKVLTYIFDRIVAKFKNHKYILLVILVAFFMGIGSLIGCYDEIVAFVPLLILLVAKFGFDKYIGISVSLFAISAGFAAGIFNSFLVAVPQKIVGEPAFAGMWLRIVAFLILFIFTSAFVLYKAKRSKKLKPIKVENSADKKSNPALSKASIAFGLSVSLGFIMIILILFVPALAPIKDSGCSLLFLAAAFLLGAMLTALIIKIPPVDFIKNFTIGIKSTLMAGILLVLASSISYTLKTSCRLPTILNGFLSITGNMSPLGYLFICYALFLLFGLFMSSGSARAFLLIPVLAPLAIAYDILYPMLLAFALADGMVSLMYPTNPILIVILNMTKTSYGDYLKKNWVYFTGFLVLSILMICFAYAVGYNALPF